MRMHHILGLALTAIFVSGSLASTALAEEWLDNGVALGGPVAIDMEGTLILEDMVAGTSIECTGTGEGVALPAGKGTIEKVTTTSCKRIKGFCNESPSARAIHLAWSISLVGGDDIEVAEEPPNGEPGYVVECFGGLVEGECTGVGLPMILLPLESPIHIEFLELEKAGNCAVGGANSGLVHGLLFLLASEVGHLLAVS